MFGIVSSFYCDPLNLENTRNVHNMADSYRMYNCAGYALGCFSWYIPFYNLDVDTMEKITEVSTNNILGDFPNVRRIYSVEEAGHNEYVIAFRMCRDLWDFHFLLRHPSGRWFHKQGSTHIKPFPASEVFKPEWAGRYTGPIVLFARSAN